MLDSITLDTLSLEELVTEAQAIERDMLWKRLDQWRLALVAKRKYGVGPAQFAGMIGSCYNTMRERVSLAEFYEPVWAELKHELEACETLYHKHLILARRGLTDLDAPFGAEKALQRLRDWARDGLSVEKAKLQVLGIPDGPPSLVKEFSGTKYELLERFKQLMSTELGDGKYTLRCYRED